ncbi:MAG: hypothetical protein ACEQSF_03265 [Solirubrobacteraceae bacterium]
MLNIKKFFLQLSWLSIIIFFFISCKVIKEPIYKEIKDFGISNFNFNEVEIKGNILFHNPNLVGVDVQTNNLSLWFMGNELSKAKTENFRAPANSDFIIPITLKFETQKITQNSSLDLLQALIGSLNGKTYEVNIKGNIVIKKFGIKYNYKLDQTKKIEF